MDSIFDDYLTLEVNNLHVDVLTGIYSEETHLPQPLRISIRAKLRIADHYDPDTPLSESKNYMDLKHAASTALPEGLHFTLIEGAGGWRVPLAGQDNLSDLAMALDLPVILVVGVRLGCISHALLTAEAIANDGLQLAGWVANIIDAKTSRLEENLATLAERLPAPCLGRVPKLKVVTAEAVAQHLQLDLLD